MNLGPAPRILLVRLSAIGDCIHGIPVLVALRKQFPKATIGWAIERGSHTLLKGHPMVDRFHEYPRHVFKKKEGTFFSRLKLLLAFRKELRSAQYDIAIDLQGLTKSGLVSWWSNANKRIGFKGEDSRELNWIFLNTPVKIPATALHVVDRNLALLDAIWQDAPPKVDWVMPDYGPEIETLTPFLKASADANAKGFVLVNPGATWLTKRWNPERFGEVSEGLIRETSLPVIVTWAGDEERRDAEQIVAIANKGLTEPLAFLAPDTGLRELAGLSSRATLFLGNDTGPLHLAVALGTPSVAIFGASDPIRNGPLGSSNHVETVDLECRPCWKTSCARKDLACLNEVTSDRVLGSCLKLIKKIKGKS